MDTLVIKGSEWLRHPKAEEQHSHYRGQLFLEAEGKRCCLGIELRREGVADEVMDDHGEPWEIADQLDDACWLVDAEDGSGTDDAGSCVGINDDHTTDDDEKIALLRPIFKSHGIRIVWRSKA